MFSSGRNRLIVFSILFFLVCKESISYSKEIGNKLNITPSVTAQVTYDSNVFKLEDKERVQALVNDSQMEDFITNYLAELELDYSTGNQRLTLIGSKDFVRFAHYKDQDYESEFLGGTAELNLGSGFFINPEYSYSSTIIPRRFNTTRQEQDFLKAKDAQVDAGYQANKWKVSALLGRTDYDYELNTSLNRKDESYGASFTIIPASTNQWYFRATHRELEFENTAQQNDNQVTDIILGASFIFTGKNLLKIEGGRRKKSFSFAKEREFEGFIGYLSLFHQVSQDTNFSLRLSRNTDTSYFTNTTYYVNNTIDGEFSWQISNKVETNFSALHRWTDYEGISGAMPLEWQKYLVLGWGLTHVPDDNVQLNLSYEFQQQDANNDAWKFKAHQVIAGLTLSWR